MTTDTATLVREFEQIATHDNPFIDWTDDMLYRPNSNGMEVHPGWTLLHSEYGQSRHVLLHEKTNRVFKFTRPSDIDLSESGRYLTTVKLDGVTYRIRLPEFEIWGDVLIVEFIDGLSDDCGEWIGEPGRGFRQGWCHHSRAISRAIEASTGAAYVDGHSGNWCYFNGEIVFFDFD